MLSEELNIIKYKREMEQMINKNVMNLKRLHEILNHLHAVHIDLPCLQRTKIGICVNNVRKTFRNNKQIYTSCAELIKKWKKTAKEQFNNSQNNTNDTTTVPNNGVLIVPFSVSEGSGGGGGDSSRSTDDPATPTMNDVQVPSSQAAEYERAASISDKRHLDTNQKTASGGHRHDFDFDDPHFLDATHSQMSSSQAVARKKARLEQQYEGSLTETRRKSIELLREALKFEPDDKNAVRLASEIEAYINMDCASDEKHYKAKIRSRVMNLRDKNNPDLLKSVILGSLSPQVFAKMSVEEMASDKMKAHRRSIEEESFLERQARDPTVGLAKSDEYPCPECNERDACYKISQERVEGEHEPVTVTYLFCNKCGHSWKVY